MEVRGKEGRVLVRASILFIAACCRGGTLGEISGGGKRSLDKMKMAGRSIVNKASSHTRFGQQRRADNLETFGHMDLQKMACVRRPQNSRPQQSCPPRDVGSDMGGGDGVLFRTTDGWRANGRGVMDLEGANLGVVNA